MQKLSVVIILFVFGVLAISGTKMFVRQKYEEVVTNSEIITAYSSGDFNRITNVAKKFGIDFQIYRNGQQVVASSGNLPIYRLVIIRQKVLPGVILEDLKSSLLSMNPNVGLTKQGVYIFFPVHTDNKSQTQYLAFKKILP